MTASERHSCSKCDRDDLTLTANGRVRSHAANGKKAGPDNPACGGGSDFPKHDHDYVLETSGEHMTYGYVCTVCGQEDPRPSAQEVRDAESVAASSSAPEEVFDLAEETLRLAEEVGVRPDEEETPVASTAQAQEAPSANDFLGSDQPEGDNSPSYFPARYDGSCDTCGADFGEGENIRRSADGGWEAEVCCGNDLDVEAELRPRATAPQLPVVGGRYRGPDPETGKSGSWMRTTNFAPTISDSFALNEWQIRMAVLGLVKRPELFERVRSMVQAHGGIKLYELAKLQREVLNGITEDARLAAGSKERARKGTILHKHTQEIDMGRKSLGDVPEEFRPDVNAYLIAMASQGFEIVPDLIERSTMVPGFRVAGTFDRILRVTRDQEAVTLDEGRTVQLHEGDYVLGDVKSGTDLSYAWLEIVIQLAIYAHGVDESGVAVPDTVNGKTTWRWASLAEFGIDRLRLDVGIVMHMPYGEGRCQFKYADLITGWRGAKICQTAIDYLKIKPSEAVVAEYVVTPKPQEFEAAGDQAKPAPVAPAAKKRRTWEDVARNVRTKDEANAVWKKMSERRQEIGMTRINDVVKIMRETLQAHGVN